MRHVSWKKHGCDSCELQPFPEAHLDLKHHLGDEVLGKIKQVIVVRIRLIELTRCELGVVSHVNPLIPVVDEVGDREEGSGVTTLSFVSG